MALTALTFENVVLNYLEVEDKQDKKKQEAINATIEVKRVAEEALVTCINTKGKIRFVFQLLIFALYLYALRSSLNYFIM